MHDNPVTKRLRQQRWRARKKAERLVAEHARQVAETAARREAIRIKVGNTRRRRAARKAAIAAAVDGKWYGTELTDNELEAEFSEVNPDFRYVADRMQSFKDTAREFGLRVNKCLLKRFTVGMLARRAVFHVLVSQGVPIAEAAIRSDTERFVPVGDTDLQREIYRKDTYAAAMLEWQGCEDEIIKAVATELRRQSLAVEAQEHERQKEQGGNTDGEGNERGEVVAGQHH